MKVTVDNIRHPQIRSMVEEYGLQEITLLGVYEDPDHPGDPEWCAALYQVGPMIVADSLHPEAWDWVNQSYHRIGPITIDSSGNPVGW